MSNPAIDDLIQSSEHGQSKNPRRYKLEWISPSSLTYPVPYSLITTVMDNVYYSTWRKLWRGYYGDLALVLLGSSKECTPTLVNEFASVYSLPTHKYDGNNNNFRRYSVWLRKRNELIYGFVKFCDDYYMVADITFQYYYSRYGFCCACGILRCSPVWCICGHKRLSDEWTSKNKQLDEFIKKSQLQTNSANDAYLEWIPYDYCITREWWGIYLDGLPTRDSVKFIPLEITDETHDLYYAELCDKHPDILNTGVWVTVGFTYDCGRYCLIKAKNRLCLGCTREYELESTINFCFNCKEPKPDWTTGTGNKSLDAFIIESWSNTKLRRDTYIQWIEYSLLTNVQEMTPLHHECTLIANLQDPAANKWTKVSLKNIVDGRNAQSFDFYQLTMEYPKILTPENLLIIGITQEPSTREYYLVFYYEIRPVLDKIIASAGLKYIEYGDFSELNEIGSGSYKTIYTAKYKRLTQPVILKQFKNFYQTLELFVSEIRTHTECVRYTQSLFLKTYGVTQNPETKECMIVMQYANNGNLLSYLDQNINKLTWRMKLECLGFIAFRLRAMHSAGFIHCNLHGRNIMLHNHTPFICDFSLSQSVNSQGSNSSIQGSLPFIAPEVFHTYRFTPKSDVYSFGIIMYLIATGEPPFQDRQFDRYLACDITGGLRPVMPDSAPKEYKKLAEQCCDADPDKRPDAQRLFNDIHALCRNNNSGMWDVPCNMVTHKTSPMFGRMNCTTL